MTAPRVGAPKQLMPPPQGPPPSSMQAGPPPSSSSSQATGGNQMVGLNTLGQPPAPPPPAPPQRSAPLPPKWQEVSHANGTYYHNTRCAAPRHAPPHPRPGRNESR
eukprot:4457625-Prymnesium_polylepis.1